MNLFDNLHQRYGWSYIKEARSWEEKEHKLARYMCHLHFNLRCLSENVVPKGVKLNITQFDSYHERKILCKTHRSILNNHVRQCNKIINDLKLKIDKSKSKIKEKLQTGEFSKLQGMIHKTKEKVFRLTKQHQVRKFRLLQRTPAYRNTPVLDTIRKKGVINLSSKPLMDGEHSLPQKGPKFAVSSPKVPLTEYIAATKKICDDLGENTIGMDCTEIYQKTKEILQHYKERKNYNRNITKKEREVLKTLREDTSHMVLTADKGIALVVMDKTQYIKNVWPSLMTGKPTNPANTPPKNCTETSKGLSESSTENMALQDYMTI